MVELVIKLSEENYTEICKCAYPNDSLVGELVYQVRNNKTLSKGHGRLIDECTVKQMIDDAKVKYDNSKILVYIFKMGSKREKARSHCPKIHKRN